MKRQTVTHPSLRRALFAGSARFGNILLSSRWNPERRPKTPRTATRAAAANALAEKQSWIVHIRKYAKLLCAKPFCRRKWCVESSLFHHACSETILPKSDGASRATSTLELPSVQRTLTLFSQHISSHPLRTFWLHFLPNYLSPRHTCERGIPPSPPNPTQLNPKSIPLWLALDAVSRHSRASHWLQGRHNCKRSKRDKEARVTETGKARKKKKRTNARTHAPLHYTRGRASCLARLSSRFVLYTKHGKEAVDGEKKQRQQEQRNPEHRPDNGLHRKPPHGAPSHFCGCLFALAWRHSLSLLAEAKKRRFLRTCCVKCARVFGLARS